MKAAYIEKTGAIEKIIYADLAKPIPTKSQVLVKVEYAALNPIDNYIRSGKFPIKLPIPFILGRDATGVVTEVGKETLRSSRRATVSFV